VLHQPSKSYNPFNWRNVAPSARHGMTESDAYGKAVDFMQSLVRQQQAQAVKQWRWQSSAGSKKGKLKRAYVPRVEVFSKTAPWRLLAATEQQLGMLERMQVRSSSSSSSSSEKWWRITVGVAEGQAQYRHAFRGHEEG
jgi:hypothetical protein